jgi:site-specific recombinase XerD
MNKKKFIAYLEGKDFAIKTIKAYVKYAEEFLMKTRKDELQITKPDILKFLEYLKNTRKVQNSYRRHHLDALNHYFTFLQKTEQIEKKPCLLLKIRGQKRKTLYKIYTSEELEQLFDNYYQLFVRNYDDSHIPKNVRKWSALGKERNALIISVLINQGITTSEIGKIELNDIDLKKATIKIRGGQHRNERVIPLKANQIGLFIHYLQNVYPQLSECLTIKSDKLFLPLPKSIQNQTNNDTLTLAIGFVISRKLKIIDKQFINLKQVRASVITFWIKTMGLRKAQYLAGHRYTSSTESYLPNNLDNLIDDINKLHPF